MIWNDLISHTSRSELSDNIRISSAFPYYENEPLEISVLSNNPMLLSDSVSIPLKEDVVIDDLWSARVWPSGLGWHYLNTYRAASNYFVVPNDSWKSLRARSNRDQTARYSSDKNISLIEVEERKKISSLFYLILFLVSAGFLWISPKLS